MAIVGEAHVIVRAITSNVDRDIRRGFSGTSRIGARAGEDLGKAFSAGFNRNMNTNVFNRISNGIRSMVPGADAARSAFASLTRTTYTVQTGVSVLLGGISALIGGLGALGGAALGAIGSLAAVGPVVAALGAGMVTARLALGGVGKALAAANRAGGGGGGGGGGGSGAAALAQREAALKRVEDAEESLARTIERNREALIDANNDVREAQEALNDAIEEGREEIQQLGFDAEDAALAESRAVIDLERARETLARVQDLPPNSRARREAELAYQEAELNLRKAKDRSSDLNAEQDRLAQTGVAGTEAVIGATNALARATANKDKVVRDGLRDEQDAVEAVADARKDAATAGQDTGGASAGGGGGVDPFAGLNQAQIDFVKFLQEIGPRFNAIKVAASEAFLPPLETAIRLIADRAIPTLVNGATLIGSALGAAAISIAEALTSAQNLAGLTSVFEVSARIIESLGRSAGSLYGGILGTLQAASPLAERFTGWLEQITAQFDGYANSTSGNSAMVEFFRKAGDAAAQFGDIFNNIFQGIGGIINANLGPGTGGGYLLDWLESATQKFADLPQSEVFAYFNDVARNAQSVMSSIGALVGELIKLGQNDAIGETFDILATGAPALGDILAKSAEAGPALADLIVTITEIIDKLTDTGSMNTFFDTLNVIATAVNDFLDDEFTMSVVNAVGVVSGFLLALGLVGNIGSFAFKTVAGVASSAASIVGGITTTVGSVAGGVGDIASAFTTVDGKLASARDGFFLMGESSNKAVSTVGKLGTALGNVASASAAGVKQAALWVAAQARAAASAVAATASMVAQRVALIAGAAASGIATAAQWLLNAALTANPIGIIIVAITALIAALVFFFTQTDLGKEIWANFMSFLTDTWNNLVSFFQTTFAFVADLWETVWSGISSFFTGVWEFMVAFVTAYIDIVMTVISTGIQIISDIWNNIWNGISTFFTALWAGIVFVVTTYINIVSTVIRTVLDFIVGIWNNIWNGISSFIADTWKNITTGVQVAIILLRTIIQNILNTISGIWNGIWNGISSFFTGIWNGIINAVRQFGNFFRDAFSGIAGFVESAFNGVLGAVRGPINGIIGIVNNAIRSLNRLKVSIPAWVPGVGGQTFGISLPTIPQLAKGGVVMPSPGGSIVNVAEAGRPERIEPLDADGLSQRDRAMMALLTSGVGNIKIDVHPSAGMDEQALAAMIGRIMAFQMRKGAI